MGDTTCRIIPATIPLAVPIATQRNLNDGAKNISRGNVMSEKPIVEINNKIGLPGEKLDQAAAELLKTALNLPAIETSNALADVIGIFGDRIKVYRAERRVTILHAAHGRLAEKGLSLDQTKPMLEGQVYDMIEGMGSAHTEELADMWAGLMANAMDPSMRVSADKTFTSVLQSLSPNDARLINFMAAVEKQTALEHKIHQEIIREYSSSMTEEERCELTRRREKLEKEMLPKKLELISLYKVMSIEDIQTNKLTLRNLARLDLIESNEVRQLPLHQTVARRREDQELLKVISELKKQINAMQGEYATKSFGSKKIASLREHQFLMYGRLTEFGREFVAACGLWDEV